MKTPALIVCATFFLWNADPRADDALELFGTVLDIIVDQTNSEASDQIETTVIEEQTGGDVASTSAQCAHSSRRLLLEADDIPFGGTYCYGKEPFQRCVINASRDDRTDCKQFHFEAYPGPHFGGKKSMDDDLEEWLYTGDGQYPWMDDGQNVADLFPGYREGDIVRGTVTKCLTEYIISGGVTTADGTVIGRETMVDWETVEISR